MVCPPATCEAGARWSRFGLVVVATTSRRNNKVQMIRPQRRLDFENKYLFFKKCSKLCTRWISPFRHFDRATFEIGQTHLFVQAKCVHFGRAKMHFLKNSTATLYHNNIYFERSTDLTKRVYFKTPLKQYSVDKVSMA
jgi:hypothetical protein